MTEAEALVKIANELFQIRILLSSIDLVLMLMLFFKRNYSRTDGIKEAIKELTNIIRSRR